MATARITPRELKMLLGFLTGVGLFLLVVGVPILGHLLFWVGLICLLLVFARERGYREKKQREPKPLTFGRVAVAVTLGILLAVFLLGLLSGLLGGLGNVLGR